MLSSTAWCTTPTSSNLDQAAGMGGIRIQRKLPGIGPAESLIKVAAVNQLYYTNVFLVYRMAEHVVRVMAEPPGDRVTLVETIAVLPAVSASQPVRNHWSFASKLAHFFVDTDCPIYDSYADRALAHHLGRGQYRSDSARPYRAFVEGINRLRDQAGLECSTKELDEYLWLAGQYLGWPGKKDRLGKDVRALFESDAEDVHTLLVRMRGRGNTDNLGLAGPSS
jgi:hypothetical protein